MEAFDVDRAVYEAAANAERALVVLREAAQDVFRVSGYGKDEPTASEALACCYACKNDLHDAFVMMEAVGALLEAALENALAAQEGFGELRKRAAA